MGLEMPWLVVVPLGCDIECAAQFEEVGGPPRALLALESIGVGCDPSESRSEQVVVRTSWNGRERLSAPPETASGPQPPSPGHEGCDRAPAFRQRGQPATQILLLNSVELLVAGF